MLLMKRCCIPYMRYKAVFQRGECYGKIWQQVSAAILSQNLAPFVSKLKERNKGDE